VRRTEVNKSYALNKDWWREFVKEKNLESRIPLEECCPWYNY